MTVTLGREEGVGFAAYILFSASCLADLMTVLVEHSGKLSWKQGEQHADPSHGYSLC